ncbi:alpha/beta hydrolase [Sphingomonas sp. Leaf4]|uniref:alpha/beta hydrolase n=1 Tax=Sphingomonas sp. Leaf4 TaxID=2876553 RepID=UPI001E3BB795|nr:alpha/beta hydrolase-fold protein [Sphingomonas sp. Leaf4]
MRPILAILTLLLLLPGIAMARPTSAGTPIAIGTSHRIDSIVLGDRRELNVWLPEGYATSATRYPVVYLLDGARDQDFPHVAGLASLASLSWTFGPFIVVGIQTRDRRAELTPPPVDPRYRSAFPASGGAPRFRRFLEREVIPFVERRYRASGKRALMGESLAGLFVVDTLLTQPALFGDYIAVSPSLWWDDRRALRDPALATRLARAANVRLFLAHADEGGTMQDGIDRLRAALAPLPPGMVMLRYADHRTDATHATVYHRAAEEALRWLYPAPPYDNGPTPWFMIEGASPPATAPMR